MTKWAAGLVIASSLTALVWAQAAPPTWKDQGESDLGIPAGNEADPVKQLDLLKKWEQQYPDSALAGQRTLLTAGALLKIIGATFTKTDAASLDLGQKSAQQLIDKEKTYFDPALKQAATTSAQWADFEKSSMLNAHALLAFIAQKKTPPDDATTESEYKKILQLDPNQATTSYQWGSLILKEMAKSKDLSRYSEVLYDLQRSLVVTGPSALPPAGQTAAQNTLKKNYTNYHGSEEGLEDLKKQVAESAIPPAGFHILSVVDIDEAKQKNHAQWEKDHPELAFWELIREQLKSGGDTFFANVKEVGFPPPPSDTYKGATMWKGTVVSMTAKDILLNVDDVIGDCLLKFDDGVTIKGTIDPGTTLSFKGVVDSYKKDPAYVLAILIQEPKDDLVGVPAGVTFPMGVKGAGAKAASGTAKKAAPKAAPKKAVKK